MTITCEKCSTRFVLDDARIPAQGARVRCSRCQHRFHVKPPPVRATPDEIAEKAVEHSAPFVPGVGREAREKDGDGALDNPEFIFEVSPSTARARPVAPEPPESAPGADEAIARSPAPPAAPAAAAVAQESEADASPFGSLPESGFTAEPETGRAAELARTAWETPSAAPTAPAPGETLGRTDDASRYEIGESDGPIGDIDPRPHAGAPTVAEAWHGFARDEMPKLELAARGRQATAAPSIEPLVARPSRASVVRAWTPRVTSCLLGFGILFASARTLYTGCVAALSAPAVVRGAGWVATDIEAFHLRDAAGQLVLVVRGALLADGAAPPPRVRALLLDDSGRPLGPAIDALPRRLSDAELESTTAAALAADGSGPAERPVRGFTALVLNVPDAAERYRLELLPGSEPAN